MGGHMACNLVQAGIDVMLWNGSSKKARAVAKETNCPIAANPRALSTACDVIITMLADDRSSEAVHLGVDGLFLGKQAHTHIEMGTMSADHIRDLADSAPTGIRVIDAPGSGATQAAADAQLMIMLGCDAEAAEPFTRLFDAMGKHTICLGEQSAVSAMKRAVNSLIHGINQTLAEAMTLADASGIAPEAAFDVIEASSACAPMLKYRRKLYLNENAHDVTFTVALARKDMAVTSELARNPGVNIQFHA